MGDFNARIQTRMGEDEEVIVGPHLFDSSRITLETQPDEVLDNRALFLDYAMEMRMKVANTLFQKPPQGLLTYKENKAHLGGPPWTRNPYETLDYILVQDQWKNSLTNIE